MSLAEGKKLRWRDCINVVLKHGQRSDQNDGRKLTSVFEIADLYGGTKKAQFVCMLGYIIGGFRGLIRNFSEGWYFLSEKGQNEKERRFPLSSEQ